jgi:hypothetical protein
MSDMSRRPALVNRIALTVIGLLLFATGAAALVRGLDLYPALFGPSHTAVVDRSARAFADRNTWFWVALATAMFVIAVAVVSWLAAQFRRDRAKTVPWEPDTPEGATTLSTSALTDAVDHDLSTSPYLRRSRTKFVGSPANPRLYLSVTVDPNADPAAAREGISHALRRLHRAVEAERLPAIVRIRTGR